MDPVTLGMAKADAKRKYAPVNPSVSNRASFAKAKAAVGVGAAFMAERTIVCIGESTVEGFNFDRSKQSFPAHLIRILTGMGFTAEPGWVYCVANAAASTWDPRWTGLTAKYAAQGSSHISQVTNAVPVLFTSINKGTVVEFIRTGAHPGYSYSIDGGAPVNVPAGGTAGVYEKVTVSGLPDATHALTFTSASTTPTYLVAARVSTPNALNLVNAGFGGSKISAWKSVQDYSLRTSSMANGIVRFDAVLLSCIINDALVLTDPAAYAADLTSVVRSFTTGGGVVALVIPIQPDPAGSPAVPDASWKALVAATYSVANTQGLAVIDVDAYVGGRTAAVANGLMSDSLHPSPSGYLHMAQAVAQLFA